MKFLFVADPLEKIKPLSDTTLVLLRESMDRRHECFWAVDTGIGYAQNKVIARARHAHRCEIDQLPVLGEELAYAVESFDVVFIRKDPPFDHSYTRLCWLLQLAEGKVYFMNRPSLLLRYHEKLISLEAFHQGFLAENDIIPTFIQAYDEAKQFAKVHRTEKMVQKPFLGFGGSNIELLTPAALDQSDRHSDQLVQPFEPEIRRGDRRVFLLNGEVLAHYVRMPAEGNFVSNLAQGGRAEPRPLTPQEEIVLEKLGKFLKFTGIHLAGADVIGHKISEVNITSPMGLRSLQKLEGKTYATEIIQLAEHSAYYGRT